jgi:hypothetical protein
MSDNTHGSAEQLTSLVQRVVASRGFNEVDQNTAGLRATFAMQHGLANSDLLETSLAGLDASLRAPKLLVENKESLIYDALGQPALVQIESIFKHAVDKGINEIRIHKTSCGAFAVQAISAYLSTHGANDQGVCIYFNNLEGGIRRFDLTPPGQLRGLLQPRERDLAWNEVRITIGPPPAGCKTVAGPTDIEAYRARSEANGIGVRTTLWNRMQELAKNH